MKGKILILLMIMITEFFFSCYDEIPKEIETFGKALIETPPLIMKLKDNFPKYSDDKYIFKETMTIDKELMKIKNGIEEGFNFNFKNVSIKKINFIDISPYLKIGYALKESECYEYNFHNDKYCLLIFILKKDNKFIIFRIDVIPYGSLENDSI